MPKAEDYKEENISQRPALEVLEKLGDIPSIKRADCRTAIIERFTQDIMVDNYKKLFEKIVSSK